MADAYVDLLHAAGYGQAIWAGLSMGGDLVLDVQRRHPEAVAGMAMGGDLVLDVQRRHPEAVAGMALLDTKGDADAPAARAHRI